MAEPNRIKERAQAIHKSLGELSRETGLNRQYVTKLAKGFIRDPRISTALVIAAALRCQVEDLWSFSVEKE